MGKLILASRHRLICGDCRDAATVDRLVDGHKINVAVTSPPYASQRTYDESSGFKPIPPDEYVDWYSAVASNIMAHLTDDGSYFCNIKEHCEEGQRSLYVKDLTIAHVRHWGVRFVDEFCWRNTKNGVPGVWPNRFKNAFEPVFHYSKNTQIKFNAISCGIKSDSAFSYSSETAETKTGSGLLGVKGGNEHEGIARPSNVIEAAAASTGEHSAAYPVALPEFFIKSFSDPGDVIYDPFMGSGTTLIAAEKNGRKSIGCEISPVYCDVIVKRFEQFTGEKAVLWVS